MYTKTDADTLLGNIGKTFPFEGYNHRGFLVRKVLPELVGKTFDEYALGLIHSLRPSFIRVCKGSHTLDAVTWRVTVFIDDNNRIKEVVQEVEVGLPENCQHGSSLNSVLLYGKDSLEHNWEEVAGETICSFGYLYKIDRLGVEHPYPNQPEDAKEKACKMFEKGIVRI